MNEEIDIEDFAPWLVVAITVIGGILRVLLLGTKGMGLDETFSVWLAGHSVGDLLQWVVRIDQHPPLYYMLLHFWIALKGGDTTSYYVRLLSVLFGAGAIPIIYLIGKRMSGVLVGLAAAVILAFSPFHIYYAQETRMYTLLMFNAAVAMYALVRLLTDPRSVRPIGSQFREYLRAWRSAGPAKPVREDEFSYADRGRGLSRWGARLPVQSLETDLAWVAFIVFSAATLYTHNTAVLFPLAVNIFVLGLMFFQRIKRSEDTPTFQAPSFWNWVKAQIGILILWSPWVVPFIKQTSAVYQRFWIPAPTWEAVLGVLRSFLNASGPVPANVSTVVWILYALVFLSGLVAFRRKIPQFLFLAVLFFIPLLGELIVSIWRPIFWDRTLIWITLPLFLVLAAGAAQVKHRFAIILVLGSLATINLFSAGDYYRFYREEDWNTAARDVAGYAKKGDLVLFNSNFVEIPFNYYFQPYETFYDIQVVKRGIPLDLFKDGILEPEMTAENIPGLIALLREYDRVWLVYSHDSYTDPMGLIPKTLASHKKIIRDDDFYGGKVQLYANP